MTRYSFLLALLLTGCATSPVPLLNRSTEINNGAQVLADVQRLYASTPVNCGSDSRPAFLCSGIIMRDADFSTSFRAWDPSPTQIAKGGVSFVYIRKDSKFLMYTGFTKGYIIFPELERPAGKTKLMMECIFPMDGSTDYRRDHGCGQGPYPNYVASDRCHILQPAVSTAAQWVNHYYNNGAAYRSLHQCAFSVPDSANQHAAPTFNAALASMALLNSTHQNESFNTWNEMLVDVWGQGLGRTFPIKAFWYRTNGQTNGLADAQKIQHDFLCSSTGGGVLLPLIRVMPPRSPTEDFIFQYNEADQSTSPCT
jgi:hypothetical protein